MVQGARAWRDQILNVGYPQALLQYRCSIERFRCAVDCGPDRWLRRSSRVGFSTRCAGPSGSPNSTPGDGCWKSEYAPGHREPVILRCSGPSCLVWLTSPVMSLQPQPRPQRSSFAMGRVSFGWRLFHVTEMTHPRRKAANRAP